MVRRFTLHSYRYPVTPVARWRQSIDICVLARAADIPPMASWPRPPMSPSPRRLVVSGLPIASRALDLAQIKALDWVGYERLSKQQKSAARDLARSCIESALDAGQDVVGKVFTTIRIGFRVLNYERADCDRFYIVSFSYVQWCSAPRRWLQAPPLPVPVVAPPPVLYFGDRRLTAGHRWQRLVRRLLASPASSYGEHC